MKIRETILPTVAFLTGIAEPVYVLSRQEWSNQHGKDPLFYESAAFPAERDFHQNSPEQPSYLLARDVAQVTTTAMSSGVLPEFDGKRLTYVDSHTYLLES